MDIARVAWSEACLGYDFGPGHPMRPIRLELTALLCRELGLLGARGVQVFEPQPAADGDLAAVHAQEFIAAVRAASGDPQHPPAGFGLGTMDVPAFAGMHQASARIADGSRQAAQAVASGAALHGVNFCGGLHHAMPAAASGFCVYNDAALAIRTLLDAGIERVAYLDTDVHHGDGVERIFWDEPRVLTISIHEWGRTLFPGTGYPAESGGPGAAGCAVNIALPPGIGDAGWLRAIDAVVPPLLAAFAPGALVSQHGCDGHFTDPLAHLAPSVDALRTAAEWAHGWAHQLCAGRWVALGGGGYEVVDVVPRAWAHLVGIAAHHPVDPAAELPDSWRAYVARRARRTVSGRMTDGAPPQFAPWSRGFDPADPVDRAVLATRRSVFPAHGIDVHL